MLLALLAFTSACGGEKEKKPVTSYLEGRLTVDPEIDPTPDYSGFEVLVAIQDTLDGIDTLGYAVTDTSGAFRMTVTAPERGVYPLYVSRRGTLLKEDRLAVAEGDSAMLTARFPVEANRSLRIRSKENAAWTAYTNSKAQYNTAMLRMLDEGAYDAVRARQNVSQASAILWSLRDNYAGTIGAEIAAAESVIMLDGWDDSLLVARARQVEPSNPSFVEVARAARRAQARLAGQEAALALVRELQAKATDDATKAGIASEVVVAYADSLRRDDALAAARALKADYDDTPWAAWADRAIYEIEHLMPGLPAPAFALTARDGRPVSLAGLRGRLVVLEFYRPEDPDFQRQLALRNALAAAVGEDTLQFVSVSLLPDTLLNDAFAEGRAFPGLHVIAPQGVESDVARAYNVSVLPTRVLIDRDGSIVRKYVGGTLARLQEDLVAILSETPPPA